MLRNCVMKSKVGRRRCDFFGSYSRFPLQAFAQKPFFLRSCSSSQGCSAKPRKNRFFSPKAFRCNRGWEIVLKRNYFENSLFLRKILKCNLFLYFSKLIVRYKVIVIILILVEYSLLYSDCIKVGCNS